MDKKKKIAKTFLLIIVMYFFMNKIFSSQQLRAEMIFGYYETLQNSLIPTRGDQHQSINETFFSRMISFYREDMVPILQYSTDYKVGAEKELVSEDYYQVENDEHSSYVAEEMPSKKEVYKKSKWYKSSYLRKYVYQIDSTTMITNGELNGEQLLSMDLSLDKSKSPQILIYHTHGSESYKDSKKGKKSDTVIGVGDELTKQLEKKGVSVIHDRHIYDMRNGKEERSKAYNYAANAIERYLKKYPSIQIVIDLHRDGVRESTKLVTSQKGKKMAQIMFFNGISRTAKNGDIKYLKNPNKKTNLAFSLQLQAQAAKKYPGFTRKIYIKGYRYNLHYRGRSLLVEVGAQNNTISQAKASMSLLAEILNDVVY